MNEEQFKQLIASVSNKVSIFSWDIIPTIIALVISFFSWRQSVKSDKENKAITIESEFNKYFIFIEDLYKFYEQILNESMVDDEDEEEDKTIPIRIRIILDSINRSEIRFNDLNNILVPTRYRESFRLTVEDFRELEKKINLKFKFLSEKFIDANDSNNKKVIAESVLKDIQNEIKDCLEEVEKLRFKNIK